MNLLTLNYSGHDREQQRLGLVTSNRDIGTSFELKSKVVDIGE